MEEVLRASKRKDIETYEEPKIFCDANFGESNEKMENIPLYTKRKSNT